jgi:hypothetical protein
MYNSYRLAVTVALILALGVGVVGVASADDLGKYLLGAAAGILAYRALDNSCNGYCGGYYYAPAPVVVAPPYYAPPVVVVPSYGPQAVVVERAPRYYAQGPRYYASPQGYGYYGGHRGWH